MTHTLTVSAAILLGAFTLTACQDDLAASQRSNRRVKTARQSVASTPTNEPLFALSTFSYAFTLEASDKTFELTRKNGQMYVVQLDSGVPWAEALSGAPLPEGERRKWENFKQKRPAGQPFYLALAPLDFDRMTLAGPPEGSTMPESIDGAAFDSKPVKTIYLKYVRRAVEYFDPDFLNIGVEAGELAHRRPSAWPAFARLIEYVMVNLKSDYPDLKIGISYGLQSLMEPATAQLVRDLVEKSDYLGLSFYPYMSEFHEKYGVAPLPDPPAQWRQPLEWARNYTSKPIAICETGYNSANTSASGFDVHLKASPDLQLQYVKDLGSIAHRDHHLFDIYYFPVDIDGVLDALPDKGASGAILWRENGLLDSDLKPKPAWEAWQNILAGEVEPLSSTAGIIDDSIAPTNASAPTSTDAPLVATIGFSNQSDLFQSGPGGNVSIQHNAGPDGGSAMKWSYSVSRSQWQWAVRTFDLGSVADATKIEFDIKGTRKGSFILQVKESDGESFFYTIKTSRTWSHLSLNLRDFELDPGTRRNGALDLENVNQIVLAVGGKQQKGSGSFLLANMVFSR